MGSNAAEKVPYSDSRESYRDELNFAEFPLALLDRPSEGQKTLEFSDSIEDRGRNTRITRKLTISASDKYGLPTPRDEEVILGLIQLSHQSQFSDRKVFFTKGELVRLLGWSDDGKSYQRISEALNKWAGITLFWEKSWWSKEEQCWVDETFHILDNVTLLDRERYSRKVEQKSPDVTAVKSSFVWNEVVFASFQSGYIKKLDLDFYRSLNSAISKKMFRFLDKKFYKRSRLEFNLRVFAMEKIGLSRNYHNGEIKRKLRNAIKELEEKGFLEAVPDEERFVKEERGSWSVVFVRKGGSKVEEGPAASSVELELVKRGVGRKMANELARSHSEKEIREKIALHDLVAKRADKPALKNPPGFLVSAIRDEYGGAAPVVRAETCAQLEAPRAASAAAAANKAEQSAVRETEEFATWWSSLSAAEQLKHEEEALSFADSFHFRHYQERKEKGGKLFEAVKLNILQAHFRRKK